MSELLIDDSEFLIPIYVSVQKFEEVRKFQEAQHRRDRRGRFTEQASVRLGDREITVVKPERAIRDGDKLVPLDVLKFDEEFARETGFYVGVGGEGGMISRGGAGTKYGDFATWIAENQSIDAAEVYVHEDGGVGFINGRHRYAWLRDQGITSIPVAMSPESVAHAKKHGLLSAVKKAWDESQHTRDKEGQFTEQATKVHGPGSSVQLPGRYDRTKLPPKSFAVTTEHGYILASQSSSDPGYYWVNHIRVSDQHQGKGEGSALFRAAAAEAKRQGFTGLMRGDIPDRPASDAAQAVWAKLKNTSTYTDAKGFVHHVLKFDESKHPRDAKGQFTETGGTTFYHGTVQAQLDSIKEHGLQTNRSGLAWPGLSQPGTIYLARTKHDAMVWAESSAIRLEWKFDNPTAVVLEIRVPADVLAKSQRTTGITATGEPEGNLRVFQDIPPEWITDVTVGRSYDAIHGRPDRPPRTPPPVVIPPFIHKQESETFYVGLVIEGERVQKGEHDYGNTQIQIAPTSSAAAALNMARNVIRDEHLMGTGKDVDPNHVTVRYGLVNEDLDGLRAFIARQAPFEAHIGQIELFPASEHSDGAVPVVARIISPELHAIEAEIGQHADFKEKSFPVYKPHCTVAYCTPEKAPRYADLFVEGSFLVHNITISHASGVKETIPFGIAIKRQWEESRHPRNPKGSSRGGEFMATLHGPRDALDSLLNKEKDVSIDRGDVRRFLELADEQLEDPDLTDLQVEGMQIFGGNGLGIERDDMPQIPPEHRQRFLEYAEKNGITITEETVDPLTLKPTQNAISARRVGKKLRQYEKGDREFPNVLVSKQSRILDGHHHWGMMAAFALEFPDAKMPIFRLQTSTKKALAAMLAYMKIHKLSRASLSGTKVAADPVSGRYVTPFVSFDKQGDEQLRMIASLNSSRLATWGFTAEAEVLGMARYKLTAVLDGRTSKFCRLVDGKVFAVPDARRKVIEVLNVQNPEDLKVVQPWPKQTRAAMAEFAKMTATQLTERGLHIPPYHPHCRTICRAIQSSAGEVKETVPSIPAEAEMFQQVTQADLQELGITATQEDVDQWNAHVGMTPVELLSKLSGMPPREVMTKPLGVGTTPITFEESGNIGFHVRGETPKGVEFKLGALLDPFTGIYYLTQADLLAGTPSAELAFLKNMFTSLIEMGLKSSATSVAVGVSGNAAYYAKLGFLPDELEWDALRLYALEGDTMIPTVLASLDPDDALLVRHLLQDKSVSAMQALVELPFTYQGRTIGEWLFGEASGTWALDLLDEGLVAHAQAYLS